MQDTLYGHPVGPLGPTAPAAQLPPAERLALTDVTHFGVYECYGRRGVSLLARTPRGDYYLPDQANQEATGNLAKLRRYLPKPIGVRTARTGGVKWTAKLQALTLARLHTPATVFVTQGKGAQSQDGRFSLVYLRGEARPWVMNDHQTGASQRFYVKPDPAWQADRMLAGLGFGEH